MFPLLTVANHERGAAVFRVVCVSPPSYTTARSIGVGWGVGGVGVCMDGCRGALCECDARHAAASRLIVCVQGLWLAFAYMVEFEGQPAFASVWVASLVFFAANVTLLCAVLANYQRKQD